MIITALLIAIIVIVLAFALVYASKPNFRTLVEAPKYEILQHEQLALHGDRVVPESE